MLGPLTRIGERVAWGTSWCWRSLEPLTLDDQLAKKVMFSCEEHSEPDRMRVFAIDKVQHLHFSLGVHNKFNDQEQPK